MIDRVKELKLSIKDALFVALKRIYDFTVSARDIELSSPPDTDMGDFSFAVFQLAKELRRPADRIGKEISEELVKESGKAYRLVKNIGPYINFFLHEGAYAEAVMSDIFDRGLQYGSSSVGGGREVLIEYSQPNTNKPQHIGHFRNNVLGDSLARILVFNGYKVIKANIINDRGIHICKSMYAYKKWGGSETPESSNLKPDHFVGKYYALYAGKERDNPDVDGEAQKLLQMWESGDEETRSLWKRMNAWVYEGWESTYRALGITFEEVDYESEIYTLGKSMVEDGLDKGLFYKRADGAVEVNLEDKNLGKKVLLRKDGTSVYIVQDFALARLRFERHPNIFKIIYVVAAPQEYHFKVLFRVMELLGYSGSYYHLGYGLVSLKTGKMSSRAGNVVLGDDLMSDMLALAKAELKKRGIEDDERARKISMAALKYYLLKIHPFQELLFDKDTAVSFAGNTGPYIQYTYARIQSVIKKAADHPIKYDRAACAVLSAQVEKEIVRLLGSFEDELIQAGETYNPGHLCNYLWNLAKSFNAFYHESQILGLEDQTLSSARLGLAKSVGVVIKIGLSLLGIDAIEQM